MNKTQAKLINNQIKALKQKASAITRKIEVGHHDLYNDPDRDARLYIRVQDDHNQCSSYIGLSLEEARSIAADLKLHIGKAAEEWEKTQRANGRIGKL